MPHLMVTAHTESSERLIFVERLTPALLESELSRDQLVDRVRWAVDDAAEAEVASPPDRDSSLADRLSRLVG